MPSSRVEPGVQIRVTDPALQAYLQRYPFASGPDEALNRRARQVVSENIFYREVGPPVEPIALAPEDTKLPAAEAERIQQLFTRIGMDAATQAVHTNDFAWEANLIPRHARNVLVVGCGDGIELLFLRAVLPEARITAIDYYNSLLPGIAEATAVTFLEGDMHRHLSSLTAEYDLIFSNHTLEHLYDPDHTLATLSALLLSGGHMVSILPMVGAPGSPFLAHIHSFLQKKASNPAAQIPSVDLVYFDLGHPWKTNPSDIAATLTRAGFDDIRIFQRRDHLCRPTPASAADLGSKRASAMSLNSALLRPLRSAARLVFAGSVPLRVRSLLFALERRLSFGTNRSMNAFCEEALFLCRKP
jgi:SAM-dependent methyltransferase